MAFTIFEYRRNHVIAAKADDELMERFTWASDLLLSMITNANLSGNGARLLAMSVFRVARELEHRGIRVTKWKEGGKNDAN